MLKEKINKKTVIIAVLLIFLAIISVFGITKAIQENKASTNENISPYEYRMVVAYFGYWKSGDTYWADIPDENGNPRRTNIGAEPDQYIEWDYWFPVATLPGNYEIEDIMNLSAYNGTWDDLHYTGESEDNVRKYYMNTAKIENEDAVIGATNTTVKFQASFRPLPPDKAYEVTEGVLYKCYIAIVIKYKNLDYVEPDPDPDPDPNPGDPGEKNIAVVVWYKEKDTEKTLADMKTLHYALGDNIVLSGQSIDGYKCVSSRMKGLTTQDFETGYVNEVVGRYDYSTPDGNYIYITFYYEEAEDPPDLTCEPEFDVDAEGTHVTMKRSDFEKAEDIYFDDVYVYISDLKFGYKDGEKMPGEHGFASWDLYFRFGEKGYDFNRWGIMDKKIHQAVNIPKEYFEPANSEETQYKMGLTVHAGLWCIGGGFGVSKTSTTLYVDIIENQPPEALYRYYTKKTLPTGGERNVYDIAYIGQDVGIDNYCSDPNGTKDIDHVVYTLINAAGKQKKIKFKMLPWGEYEQESADDFSDTSLIYKGADDGNLDVVFTTDEEWRVTIYVQDQDGLADVYSDIIKPEALSLKPTAVIKDAREYRYPDGENEFSGKQNRIVKLNSSSSYVATWLSDMDVTIDHGKDMWSIEPMDGQDINSVKLEKDDINKIISGNILNARYEPLDNKIMFKEPGRYKIKLQVTDTEGNISDWTEQILVIHEDLAPAVTADINPKYYRDSNKNAVITFNALANSSDYDTAKVESIGYRFDSDNDGDFEDENIQAVNLTHKDVNIGGIIYRQITLTASKVGKYQFIINVKEEFGQETLSKYIENKDYKTANVSIATEIDNIAPVASLGLQKENNIDVKILTSGLTGTRGQDVQNNIANLKSWLESANNIKTGNIEVVDIGKSINGLEQGLEWQKVKMAGIKDYVQFWYTQDETGARKMLPSGVYATGWNDIPIPKLYLYSRDYFNKPDEYEFKLDGTTWSRWITAVKENYFDYHYETNYIEIGDLQGGRWTHINDEATEFQAVTETDIKDFDIRFNFEYTLKRDSQFWEELEPHFFKEYLLFNVQDKNNYFAIAHNNINIDDRDDLWSDDLEEYYDYPWELIQIKNGSVKMIHKFSKVELKNRDIERLIQTGNQVELFNTWGDKVYSGYIDDYKVGGRLGIAGQGCSPDPDCLKTLKMNIEQLTFTENTSIYDSLERLKWKENADRYVINLAEGNKIEELINSAQLNKTAGKLQAEEINLINVGVNSVNGTKLKELVTKNQNNGTWIDIGNVYNNFNSAAAYIRNRYAGQTTAPDYILLGDKVIYAENYSDAENDPIFKKEYKYNHTPNYFENNFGTIADNNIWQEQLENISNKTGKYVLSYRIKDNPLYPNLDIWSLFDTYRKYSSEFSKTIYIHRKPIANFSIDKSFKDNALIKTTLLLKDLTRVYPYEDGDGNDDHKYYDADVDYDKNEVYMLVYDSNDYTKYDYAAFETNGPIPSNAINSILSYHRKYKASFNSGKSISESEDCIEWPEPGKKVEKCFKLKEARDEVEETISDFKIEYYQPNPNVQVKIAENSFDLDHRSQSNKGITEWQWKIVDKNGVTTAYNTTNRPAGINWIQNTLSTGQKWKDASVQLRVKDMEGAYSDWTEAYIDEGTVLDPDIPDATQRKPIADFSIENNPMILHSQTQSIIDNSYDPERLALTYAWTVKKAGVTLLMAYTQNIDAQLNQKILENGIGTYEITLAVTNTKGIQSDTVTKAFEVIVHNQAPTVNFDLVSNENPTWTFPKILGLHTLKYRPVNSFFYEEKTRFNVSATDTNSDNLGFLYHWKLERFAVKNINNISGTAANTYNFTTQYPFTNSFKGQGLPWGAYRIALSVTDKPPVPPYASGDAKTATTTKDYYIVPELNLTGSFEGNDEIMVGDTIKLKAKTSNETENVYCTFAGTTYTLSKVSGDSNYAYWEKNITIPDSITESGTYQLQFAGSTTYGGNGNITREVRDTVPLDIVALKLINFRITDIVNHPYITFPYTKDMLINQLIPYKTGYYVTFRIDSKGKPDNVYGRIDIGNNGIDQVVNMSKVVSGDTETWQGRFYTSAYLSAGTVISIKLDCSKGSVIYNYNVKENWDGRSLIVDGSALQDGRINLTN